MGILSFFSKTSSEPKKAERPAARSLPAMPKQTNADIRRAGQDEAIRIKDLMGNMPEHNINSADVQSYRDWAKGLAEEHIQNLIPRNANINITLRWKKSNIAYLDPMGFYFFPTDIIGHDSFVLLKRSPGDFVSPYGFCLDASTCMTREQLDKYIKEKVGLKSGKPFIIPPSNDSDTELRKRKET